MTKSVVARAFFTKSNFVKSSECTVCGKDGLSEDIKSLSKMRCKVPLNEYKHLQYLAHCIYLPFFKLFFKFVLFEVYFDIWLEEVWIVVRQPLYF